uniref:Transmembrane protein 213 n=1 Tax=Callithrix jacchus TaxID=9483 RepID=A0A2R8PNH4_CALJA
MQRLTAATRAALILGLALASFPWACSADVDFCPQAAQCCHAGVDEYGWIAAAVGWSLWFLTLILLCVDKLMKLTPDEPKDLEA